MSSSVVSNTESSRDPEGIKIKVPSSRNEEDYADNGSLVADPNITNNSNNNDNYNEVGGEEFSTATPRTVTTMDTTTTANTSSVVEANQPLASDNNNAAPDVSQQQVHQHAVYQGPTDAVTPQGHTDAASRRFPTFKNQSDDAAPADTAARHIINEQRRSQNHAVAPQQGHLGENADDAAAPDTEQRNKNDHLSHDHDEQLPILIIPDAYPVTTEDSAAARPDSYTSPPVTDSYTSPPVTEPVDQTKDESSENFDFEIGAPTAKSKHRYTLYYRIAGVVLCIGAVLAIALPLTLGNKNKNKKDVFFAQIGNNITGKEVNSYLGSAVDLSASGHRLITTTSRAAKVFELNSGTWQQLGHDILLYNTTRASSELNLASNKLLSAAMDESGDYIVVGNPMYANSSGSVHVYSYDDITEDWEPMGIIGMNLTGSSPKELFGTAVCIQSDSNAIRIAVGAPGHENSRGMISVYEWFPPEQSWVPLGSMIQGDSSSTVQELGGSVSLSLDGTVVAGGGRSVANVGSSRLTQDPVVKVFAYDLRNDIWNPVGQGVKPDAVAFSTAWFVDLSANGKRMVVSNSYLREEDFVNEDPMSLVVQVYELKADNWNPLGGNIHEDKQGEKSGYLVSFSNDGNTIAMGDSGTNSGGRSNGHAHIYSYKSINSNWVQAGPDINGEADADRFGFSVAVSGDGTRFVVGAPLSRAGAINGGRVQVFNIPMDKM